MRCAASTEWNPDAGRAAGVLSLTGRPAAGEAPRLPPLALPDGLCEAAFGQLGLCELCPRRGGLEVEEVARAPAGHLTGQRRLAALAWAQEGAHWHAREHVRDIGDGPRAGDAGRSRSLHF
jgi:hypothetical protein